MLEEETKKREFLEKQWNETQYDEEWDSGKDGWESWHEDEEDLEPTVPSGGSSYETVSPLPSSKDSPKVEDEEPKSEIAQMIKLVMDGQQKAVEFMLKQATKTSEEKDLLDQEDQRIKVLDLEPLKDLTEHNASIVCGDWLHRIRPVIKNMSKRSSKYWTKLEKIVDERYKGFLKLTPTERLKLEPMKDPELCKEEYSKVKAIIMEMILKSIPLDLATEATQKRLEEPTELMLTIMTKYQPGSRKEKEMLLQQITNPEVCWTEEQSLSSLKLWKWRIERAKELNLMIPDPAVLLSSLDTITDKVVGKDARRKFRMESARGNIKVDVVTSKESVEKLALTLEGDLEQSVSSTWTTITPKVKAITADPKGKGKGGKGNDGKGKDGKGKDGNGKGKDGKGKDKSKEPCYYFTETEGGCNKGQRCSRHHRSLKPDEK